MRVLVTGGGGFLGRYIIDALLSLRPVEVISSRDNFKKYPEITIQVRAFGRNRYPFLENKGVECVQGDIRNLKDIMDACQNCDMVFHTAAMAGIWGELNDFYSINYNGTSNVIKACFEHKIPYLVYTSSPSVVFQAADQEGIDETCDYPAKYLSYYSQTKAMAEKLVLSKHRVGDIRAIALRPHLIYGPGDPHLLPRVIARAKKGQLRIVGRGNNRVDITYAVNAAHAHILAMRALLGKSFSFTYGKNIMDGQPIKAEEQTIPAALQLDRLPPPPANATGRAYFISDGAPVELWPWINRVLERLEIPKVSSYISYPMAYGVGAFLEAVYTLFRLKGEPRMTRFLAAQLAHSHWYDLRAAREFLGYTPPVSPEIAFEKLIAYLKTLSI